VWLRSCIVIAGLTAIALCVVILRAEQARCAARVMALESQWVSSRSALWSIHARAARLRAPRQVHDRTVLLQAGVVPADRQELAENAVQVVKTSKGSPHGAKRATP
jgi:hypothetical protein